MRRNPLVLAWLVLVVVCFFSQSWAACPEDPNDNGVCDTMYVEIWPGDDTTSVFPHFVRFPIYVTNDIPNPVLDSIAGFVIPLCFTSSNANSNAIIDPEKNRCGYQDLWRHLHWHGYNMNHSVFRDLPSLEDPQVLNWMMDLAEEFGPEWDTRILNLANGDNFWLSLVASGIQDRRFKGGSRVLVASIMFTIEDTTTICIDSCYWPPAPTGRLQFSRSDAVVYVPRHFLPVCEPVRHGSMPPRFIDRVEDQTHAANGHYSTDDFTVIDENGLITDIQASFSGEGLDNVTLVLFESSSQDMITGHVEYDVTDHCQAGGTVTLTAWDDEGHPGGSEFGVVLSNNPPVVNLPDTWRALARYTMELLVSAVDPDGDSVTGLELDALWYEPDPQQAPTFPPTFDGGNPGLFSWLVAEGETGTWICSFSATDLCGRESTHLLSLEVGMPLCGDCFGEGDISLSDVVCLIRYLYKEGSHPAPLCQGDANCDEAINVGDLVLLISYLYKRGTAPCFDCCP